MKINELPELSTLSNDTLLLVWDTATNTTQKISVIALKTFLDSQGGNGGSNIITLAYSYNGDSEGAFYFIGSGNKTQTWQNPHTAGFIDISLSTFYPGANNPDFLCDRSESNNISTLNNPIEFFLVDLKNYKLALNNYTIRGRSQDSLNPASWTMQAKNNEDEAWTVIDSVANADIANNQWGNFTVSPSNTTKFRYFKFVQTLNNGGSNYLTMGELELYGHLEIL